MSLRALFEFVCLQLSLDSTNGFRTPRFLVQNESRRVLWTESVSGYFLNIFVSNQAEIQLMASEHPIFLYKTSLGEFYELNLSLGTF